MNLTLTWRNFNISPVSMAIYRGDAPLNAASLPAPLVTLTAGEETWVDTTVVRGQLYYYMFVTTGATDKVPTRNYPILAVPRRGHGPNDLIYGDYELGYFGSMPSSEFVASVDILRAIGYDGAAAGAAVNSTAATPVWHKFAFKGKILLIPEKAIVTTGMTWMTLAQRGAVYGTGTALPDLTTPKHNTVQNASITVNTDRYLIRLPRGAETDLNAFYTGTGGAITTGNAEFDAVVAPLLQQVNANQKLPNVGVYTGSQFNMSGLSRGILCQEVATSTTVLERGSTNTVNPLSVSLSTVTTAPTSSSCFLPILELVEA